MSCKNFETVVTELARGQMLDAVERENALEHLKACQPCAARLADERALTAGLRHVASIQSTMDAPASIESALVTAFRQRGQTPVMTATTPTTRTLSRWAVLGIAAAAALLVVSALAVTRLLDIDSRESVRRDPPIVQPAPTSSPTIAEKDSGRPPSEFMPAPPDEEQLPGGIPTSPRVYERPHGLMKDARFNNRPIRNAPIYGPAPQANYEVSTEFMPLTYGGLAQVDDGQVIRVEVPRSALQSFGLPVDVERANERIKADILLGHDGVARAIRFVR